MEIIRGKQAKPIKGLVYGPEGVGKSTLAAKFPRPLFIDAEGGTNQLDVARTIRPASWAHVKQQVADIVKDQHGYQTLVIDTADWVEKLAIGQVCATRGVKGLGGGNDYGASYNELAGLWGELLTGLELDLVDAGKMHVVFLAHSTCKKFELPEEAGAFDRYELALEKKVSALLKGWSDLMLFVNYKTIVEVDEKTKKATAQGGSRRIICAEHTAAFDAKNRFDLPREFDLDYAKIAHCFEPLTAPARTAALAKAAPLVDELSKRKPLPTGQSTVDDADIAKPEPAVMTQEDITGPEISPQHTAFQRMIADAGVTYPDVLKVLVARGRYPEGTPFENIDPKFIAGWVNKHWQRILQEINDGKES